MLGVPSMLFGLLEGFGVSIACSGQDIEAQICLVSKDVRWVGDVYSNDHSGAFLKESQLISWQQLVCSSVLQIELENNIGKVLRAFVKLVMNDTDRANTCQFV